jgi:hypothetical protein
MASAKRKRLDDLLLARATEGLNAAEEQELARLLTLDRDVDAGAYEHAAAAVCLAVLGGRGELPAALRARLERSARELASSPKER